MSYNPLKHAKLFEYNEYEKQNVFAVDWVASYIGFNRAMIKKILRRKWIPQKFLPIRAIYLLPRHFSEFRDFVIRKVGTQKTYAAVQRNCMEFDGVPIIEYNDDAERHIEYTLLMEKRNKEKLMQKIDGIGWVAFYINHPEKQN